VEGIGGRATKTIYWMKQTLRRDLKDPGFFSLEKRLRGEANEDCKIMKATFKGCWNCCLLIPKCKNRGALNENGSR